MDIDTSIAFFTTLMKNFRLPVWRFDDGSIPEFDLGLRASLKIDLRESFPRDLIIAEKTIYLITDSFLASYLLVPLPGREYLLAGPFLFEGVDDPAIMSCMEINGLSPALLPHMRSFYAQLIIIPGVNVLLTAASALGEMLWGSADVFTIQRMSVQELISSNLSADDISNLRMSAGERQAIETRYEVEAQLMYAIAHGQTHQAGIILSAFQPSHMEKRSSVPLRNIKNYAIICNTLMRKAAQQGGVHPVYIDRLSSSMGFQIEKITSMEEGFRFIFHMLHKYCLLVRNHTTKQYSQPVQQVILRVDTEIDGDLSLSAHARYLGMNASYLSALFKKETGTTITDYVSKARIDYSIFLLNSTDMQIQTIAQHCGIPDVNYFTRMFKAIVGKTPTQYRQLTRSLSL